jgi:hypothetical protein
MKYSSWGLDNKREKTNREKLGFFRQAEHIAYMCEIIYAYRIFVANLLETGQ